MRLSAEDDAAAAIRELRRFIALYDGANVEPDSETAANVAIARRAIAAYEEVQSWDLGDRA